MKDFEWLNKQWQRSENNTDDIISTNNNVVVKTDATYPNELPNTYFYKKIKVNKGGNLWLKCNTRCENDFTLIGVQLINETTNDESSIGRASSKQELYIPVRKDDIVMIKLHKHSFNKRFGLTKDDVLYYSNIEIELLEKEDYKVETLVIGDSTTGLVRYGMSWTEILERKYKMGVCNCGFVKASILEGMDYQYKPFNLYNIIDSLLCKNFDAIEKASSQLTKWHKMSCENLKNVCTKDLKNIVILLGTIDWFENRPVDKEIKALDKSLKLLRKHLPSCNIYVMLPYYNELCDNIEDLEYRNMKIEHFLNKEYPFIKTINLLDVFNCNKQNIDYYTYDKKHLTHNGADSLADLVYNYLDKG